VRTLSIDTPTHGRVLVEDAADTSPSGLLVAFHGYAQHAIDVLAEVQRIPGASDWRIAAVQALHRFYAPRSQNVVASWMTKEDRESAIADNIEYVDRATAAVLGFEALPVVFVGFSQGASMAYRAGVLGRHRARGVIALGGDIPPELKTSAPHKWPAVLMGAGNRDTWYTPAKLDDDEAFLSGHEIPHTVIRLTSGHEWTDAFRQAAGNWLSMLVSG
jgi:predicted esterase